MSRVERIPEAEIDRVCARIDGGAPRWQVAGRTEQFPATSHRYGWTGRLEDPDTLFFQRRLVIEGDTELGLGVKNFLDGLDEEQLPGPLRHALRTFRAVAGKMDELGR